MDRQKIYTRALHRFQQLINHAEAVVTQQFTPNTPPIFDNTSQASDWIARLF
jgi:alpha-ketoglutarate-dependent taurine dioxygenase